MTTENQLDLNLLRALDALFLRRSVSGAAELLGVSQPAMSQKLSQLRQHFGDPLFVRVGTAMEPTPRAQTLRQPLQRILNELIGLSANGGDFDPTQHERAFALCISDSTELSSFHSFLTRFRQAAPGCLLQSLRVPNAEIPDLLERGVLDIAIGGLLSKMPSVLRQVRVYRYDHVCLAAIDHPAIQNGVFSCPLFKED